MLDPILGPLIALLDTNTPVKWTCLTQKEKDKTEKMKAIGKYRMTGGILHFVEIDGRGSIVIPKSLIRDCLKHVHDTPLYAHLGMTNTVRKLRRTLYWQGMKRDVISYIRSCDWCQKRKQGQNRQDGLLVPQFVPSPWHTVAIDIFGPLPNSKKGNKYVLVMMDCFIGWVELRAIPDKKQKGVADAIFEEIICRHGVPKRLLSDGGGEFRNKLLMRLSERMGIEQVCTSAYHPQSNGKVERFNRVLGAALATYTDRKLDNWDEYLPPIAFAYNTSDIAQTEVSRFSLLYGRKPTLPHEVLFDDDKAVLDLEQYGLNLTGRLSQIYNKVRETRLKMNKNMKDRYDRGKNNIEYNIEDKVLIYFPRRKLGSGGKLQCEWTGPWHVIQKIHTHKYRVTWKGERKDGHETVAHVSRMRPTNDRREWNKTTGRMRRRRKIEK
jgi:transposase InsO family protein